MISDQEIRKLLASVLKGDEPLEWATDYDFRKSAVDSLDMVNFTLKLEEATGLHVPDGEFEAMRTIDGVQQVLARLQSQGGAEGQ